MNGQTEQLILNNQGLVYDCLRQLGITRRFSEYEDMVSTGEIGLIKAAYSFDDSKSNKFAALAIPYIRDEIRQYFRERKKYAKELYLDEPIKNGSKGRGAYTLRDVIASPENNIDEEVVYKDKYVKLANIVLNCLEGNYRLSLLYMMANFVQQEIAEKLNVSQSDVSKVESQAIQTVKALAGKQEDYKEQFNMSIVEDEYKISFSSKNVKKIKQIFAETLQKEPVEKVPGFKIVCSKELVEIYMPAQTESFSFIAQIIQETDETDEFSMSYNK